MGALLLRLRAWWETADRTQRVVTIFGSVFLVLLLGGTFFFASQPKMAMAYGGLSPAEAGAIVTEIQKIGIPVNSDLQGNVFVPENKLAEVRAKIAQSGRTPASGHLGNEELAKIGMMSTPTVEKERLKTILEGELARSIEAIEGVGSARVHVTLGDRSPFATESRPATASVFLTEKALSSVGSEQARSIAMLVARGVPGLDIANVFVIDNAGRSLFDGAQAKGTGSQANDKMNAEIQEAQRRERDLQATFDATFGAGNTVVKVNLAMDFDKESVNKNTVVPTKTPITSQKAIEQVDMGAGGTGAGNTAGATPNEPNAQAGGTNPNAATGPKGYTGNQERTEFAISTTETRTEKAVGDIRRMSVAVMLTKGKENELEAVRSFLANYLAAYPGAKGDVTVVEFDKTLAEANKKADAAAASQAQMQQIFSLLPVLALVAVAVMVMKSIAKVAKASNVSVTALPGGALVAGTVPGGGPMTPAQAAAQALVRADGGQGIPDGEGGIHWVEEEDSAEVRAIKERLNLPLEQIKRMATDRPEAVAMLLKSWMLEERR